MRMVLALALVLVLPACGGGGGGSSPSGPSNPQPTPVPTPTPQPAAFGPGQHLLGSGIGAGRYFADPPGSSCYWERLRGLGGTLGEIIANDFIGYDSRQVIVDVLASDLAFAPTGNCGNWFTTPRQPAQTTIVPGTWLVGSQVQPGTYSATVTSGCYWERLRDFTGGLGAIIANDFIGDAGPRSVTISAGDVGFTADGQCGTWTRTSDRVVPMAAPSRAEIASARALNRQRNGLE